MQVNVLYWWGSWLCFSISSISVRFSKQVLYSREADDFDIENFFAAWSKAAFNFPPFFLISISTKSPTSNQRALTGRLFSAAR